MPMLEPYTVDVIVQAVAGTNLSAGIELMESLERKVKEDRDEIVRLKALIEKSTKDLTEREGRIGGEEALLAMLEERYGNPQQARKQKEEQKAQAAAKAVATMKAPELTVKIEPPKLNTSGIRPASPIKWQGSEVTLPEVIAPAPAPAQENPHIAPPKQEKQRRSYTKRLPEELAYRYDEQGNQLMHISYEEFVLCWLDWPVKTKGQPSVQKIAAAFGYIERKPSRLLTYYRRAEKAGDIEPNPQIQARRKTESGQKHKAA